MPSGTRRAQAQSDAANYSSRGRSYCEDYWQIQEFDRISPVLFVKFGILINIKHQLSGRDCITISGWDEVPSCGSGSPEHRAAAAGGD